VKDMLAVLRWAENPADRVTGFRVLQLMEGVGPAIAGKVLDAVAGRGGACSAAGALAGYRPPAKAAAPWRDLAGLIGRLQDPDLAWPADLDLVRQWYQPRLEQRFDDAVVRAADLDQLARIAATCPSRARFLTDLSLDPPEAASGNAGAPLRDEDYLILSTIHSAKGQEWKAVFVLDAVDGCIPSDMATGTPEEIEEERRLLYVAMTRARDRLALVLPQRFYPRQQARRGDRHLYAARTRFIPAGLLCHFECTAWPAASQVSASAGKAGAPAVDLPARLRGRWRRTDTLAPLAGRGSE
jgi:DNA helicase-2/ATP-dependent DNA helicase PcrA